MTTRIPPLAGALNFRDLGGYFTQDGRSVRWRILYRSGTTHALTAEDLQVISDSGIRYAYDLRSNRERSKYPSRLTEIANLRYRFRDHEQLPGNLKQLLRSADGRPEHSRRRMLSMYRQLPYEFQAPLQSIFRHLIDADLPLVFNCTAGKDRTGVAAALIFAALGVARDAILEDYLLTAEFFERSCEVLIGEVNGGSYEGVPREVWEPFMRVYPEYLNAMFDELDASHGSVARYLGAQLGIDGAALERLRDNLLE